MTYDDETLNAKKHAAYIPMSDEQLMDYGIIPDTRPVRPVARLPWRYRLRWWIDVQRERLGEKIAGRRFGDDDE